MYSRLLFILLFSSFIYSEFVSLEKAEKVAESLIVSNGLESNQFYIESVFT